MLIEAQLVEPSAHTSVLRATYAGGDALRSTKDAPGATE
jgi:hypothetical protein